MKEGYNMQMQKTVKPAGKINLIFPIKRYKPARYAHIIQKLKRWLPYDLLLR